MHVDGVFLGHRLIDGRMARSSSRPSSLWEPFCQAQVGKLHPYLLNKVWTATFGVETAIGDKAECGPRPTNTGI